MLPGVTPTVITAEQLTSIATRMEPTIQAIAADAAKGIDNTISNWVHDVYAALHHAAHTIDSQASAASASGSGK